MFPINASSFSELMAGDQLIIYAIMSVLNALILFFASMKFILVLQQVMVPLQIIRLISNLMKTIQIITVLIMMMKIHIMKTLKKTVIVNR